MPFLIGPCCIDQIVSPDPVSPDASGKNEVIKFENVSFITLPWNPTRKNRFGDAGVIKVEIQGEDGKYRPASVEVVPNDPDNTTSYDIDLGGLCNCRLIIT